MRERTLWMGIKAEAKQKTDEYTVRIAGLRESLRMRLMPTDPDRLDDEAIFSLATDLRSAKIEYRKHMDTLRQARIELGEID